MDNYEEQSDFDINKAVAEALGLDVEVCTVTDYGDGVDNSEEVLSIKNGPFINYCNNPSDAWPIILEHGINTIWSYGSAAKKWTASNTMRVIPDSKKGQFEVVDDNPLRAAMIVFLKMEQGQ